MAGAWLMRAEGRLPHAVLYGREQPYEGPIAELIRSSASVTLLTFGGREVIVAEIEEGVGGLWQGRLFKAVEGPGSPAVGDLVEFSSSQVQSATQSEPLEC